MTAQNHIVHRETLEIRIEGAVEGWSIQKRMERINEDRILPVLDEVFSLLSPVEENLRIDRLVIDLGRLSLKGLDRELPGRLRQGLLEALEPIAKSREVGVSLDEAGEPGSPGRDGIWKMRRLSREESGIELLRFFLEMGFLPWCSPGTSMEELLAHLIETVPQEVKTTVLEYSAFEPFRTRLVYQFSDALLLKVFRLVDPEKSKRIGAWFHDLDEAAARLPWALFKTGHWRKVFWGYVFKEPHEPVADGTRDAFRLLKALAEEARIGAGALTAASAPLSAQGGPDGAGPASRREPSSPELVLRPHFSGPEAEAHEVEALEIRVENWGLVLLWPFLARLFHAVGYVDEKGFLDQEKRIRGVHLLEYAATGKEVREEPFLALNKVLCGLDVMAPVPLEVGLGPQERTEVRELLGSVISRWTALKNTSTDALRSAFLKRQGLLALGEEEWNLRVERKPYDLLLDRLPWGIGMMKLSWMRRLLRVEW